MSRVFDFDNLMEIDNDKERFFLKMISVDFQDLP